MRPAVENRDVRRRRQRPASPPRRGPEQCRAERGWACGCSGERAERRSPKCRRAPAPANMGERYARQARTGRVDAAASGIDCRRMAAPATAEAIRDVNTRYHDAAAEHYDTKWGVDFGDVGAPGPRQAAQAAGQAAADVRALAGDRRRHRLLHAEHAAGRRRCARPTATDISPGMLDALQANAERIGVDRRDGRLRRRGAALRRRLLRPRPRPRGPAPPPRTSTAPSREFLRVLRPGGAVRSSPASRRAPAIASPPIRSAPR